MTAAAALSANPHFAGLSEADAQALLARAVQRHFVPGQTLMREGQPGESLVVLESGSVEVRRGEALLATLGPGATFGEMALLDPAPRSASVVAVAAGAAWELSRAALWGLLGDGDPAAVRALQGLTATVCARLEDVNRRVQEEVVKPRGNVFGRLWKAVSQGLGKRA